MSDVYYLGEFVDEFNAECGGFFTFYVNAVLDAGRS
jgi:hypothetical protein